MSEPERKVQQSHWISHQWPWLFLLLLGTAAAYSNTLHSPFVLDDFHSFVNNPELHLQELSWKSLTQLGSTKFGIRRLVPVLTLALDYYFGGGGVVQYHLTNIAIHLICTLLVFLFVRKLLIAGRSQGRQRFLSVSWFALAAAGLWALNPVQTNAVTYLVQRMTSLAALFYIGALVCYLYARLASSIRRRNMFFALALVSAFAAFLSKENTFTLPAAILLVEYYFLSPAVFKRITRNMGIRQWALVIAAAAVLLLLFFWLAGDFLAGVLAGYAKRDFTLAERLLTQLRVVAWYISLLILPLPGRLNLEHDFPLSVALFAPPTTFFALLLLLGLLLIGIMTRRSHPLLSFGIIWFFLHLLIESTVVPLEIIFEHRLYLPSVGFFIAIVFLLEKAGQAIQESVKKESAQKMIAFATVILLVGSAALTYARNQDWRDPLTIYTDIVRKSPGKARPNNDLGVIYAEMGNYDIAEKYYRKALAVDPDNADSYNNLGFLYARIGMLDKAIESYRQAILIEPKAAYFNNLGSAYSRKGMLEKAVESFDKALALNPLDPGFYTNKGEVFEKKGEFEKAILEYRKALQISPDYSEAYNRLGIVHAKKGLADKAIHYFQSALRIDGDNAGYHNNIANAYMMKGLVRQAEEHRRLALYYRDGKQNASKNNSMRR